MDTRLKKALKDFLSSYVKVHNKNLTMDDIEVTFVKGFNAGQMSMKNSTSTLTAKVKRYETALEFYANPLSWDYNQTHDDMTAIESSDHEVPEGLCDNRGGKRARAALNQGGEK